MAPNDKIDWKSKGFNATLTREANQNPQQPARINGQQLESLLTDLTINRMIQLKNLVPGQAPQGNDLGKIYYDKVNQKYKMWVGGVAGWVDIQYTSTSTSTTSTTSSSSSSTSTSTT